MKKYRIIKAAILITLVFNAHKSEAALTGTVSGTDGNPISGAKLTFIQNDYQDNVMRGVTDDNGHYTINLIVGVDEKYGDAPKTFGVDQNFPNPFNPTTTITFTLDASEHVSLSIFNIMGQHISTLVDTEMGAGRHTVTWNGMNEQGNHVSAGIYLYRLKSGSHSETRKMLLLDGGMGSAISNAGDSSYQKPANTQSADNITGYNGFTVIITHKDYIDYWNTSLVINESDVMDFVLNKSFSIPDGINLVSIPAVTDPYVMNPDDGGNFSVTLSAYEMSAALVTNDQYAHYLNEALASGFITVTSTSIIGANGEWGGNIYFDFNAFGAQIDYIDGTFTVESGINKRPVVRVSWYGAVAFADFYGLDLPREAEWQYAASGGRNHEYGTDNGTIDSSKANYYSNVGHTTDVESYPGNPFGLYDMAGNIWEWCHDWFKKYPSGIRDDYYNIDDMLSAMRVVRGGDWGSSEDYCRTEYRNYSAPEGKKDVGFRLVRRQ